MIVLSRALVDELTRHAKACYPQEACGFLAGRAAGGSPGPCQRLAQFFFPIENMEHSTTSYLMDPRQQMKAFRKMDEMKLDLVGIVHSHVASPATPSQKDRTLAFYPEVSYLIVSLSDMRHPDLQSFEIIDGKDRAEEIEIRG